MAEFCIYPQQVNGAAAQLDDVASKITNVQKMVADAACGLGPIGIASVGANILAIEARLAANKVKVLTLSSALKNIGRIYNITEDTIQGQGFIAFIRQLIESASESVSSFLDDSQNFGLSFIDWTRGFWGSAVAAWHDFSDTLWNGHFEWNPGFSQGVTIDFFDGLWHEDINIGLLDMDLAHDAIAQIFDENGHLSPEFMQMFSGEGSLFSLSDNFSIGNLFSSDSEINFGEFDFSVLTDMGLLTENGFYNPHFTFLGDGDFTVLHVTNTTSVGYHTVVTDVSVGDATLHRGSGNTLTDFGSAGYASATGASASVLDYYGNDYLASITGAQFDFATAEAGAGIDGGFLNERGEFSPHFFVGLAADASAASVTGITGTRILGTDFKIGVSGDGEGVGGIGYISLQDGVLSASIGADWGLGIGITGEIDFTHTGETLTNMYHDIDNNGLSSVIYGTIEANSGRPQGIISNIMSNSVVTDALDTVGEIGIGAIDLASDGIDYVGGKISDAKAGWDNFWDEHRRW